MDESENSRWGIMTHNYTFDCYKQGPRATGHSCSAGAFKGYSNPTAGYGLRAGATFHDYGASGCLRCAGAYPICLGNQGQKNSNWGAPATTTGFAGARRCFAMASSTPRNCDPDKGYCNNSKSDKRLKKKIKYIETTKAGLKLYTFEFKKSYINRAKISNNIDLSGTYKGVMAQDLINTEFEPNIWIEQDGYYIVDYDGLGIKLEKLK